MNSKSRLWQFLSDKGEATNAQIAEFFRGTKGQLSWSQRLREIRKDLQRKGGDLVCKEIRTGIYLYKIIYPEPAPTAHEEALCHANAGQELIINTKAAQYEFEGVG